MAVPAPAEVLGRHAAQSYITARSQKKKSTEDPKMPHEWLATQK